MNNNLIEFKIMSKGMSTSSIKKIINAYYLDFS